MLQTDRQNCGSPNPLLGFNEFAEQLIGLRETLWIIGLVQRIQMKRCIGQGMGEEAWSVHAFSGHLVIFSRFPFVFHGDFIAQV